MSKIYFRLLTILVNNRNNRKDISLDLSRNCKIELFRDWYIVSIQVALEIVLENASNLSIRRVIKLEMNYLDYYFIFVHRNYHSSF